jgi:simple sugar transport system ATP-binding protein
MSGAESPDGGEIRIRGVQQRRWTPRIARRCGIETVYQDKALAEQQTIARNIFMGRELTTRLGFVRLREQAAMANKVMREIGFTSRQFDANSIVNGLSGGERQGVAIGRALHFKADLIILDEPTNALAISEADKVLRFITQIRDRGSSAIFISHNIAHAYQI